VLDTNIHFLMTWGRMTLTDPEHTVPPRQAKTKVVVAFPRLYRVVDPVHVRGDYKPMHTAIQRQREAHVPVIEHCCGV
jgi:hypothetical protein